MVGIQENKMAMSGKGQKTRIIVGFALFVAGFLCSKYMSTRRTILRPPVSEINSSMQPPRYGESGTIAKVILFGYWRSGSSVMGELFNQHPRAFYIFEPINGFSFPINTSYHDVYRDSAGKLQLRKTEFTWVEIKHSDSELSAMLGGILNCDLDRVPEATLAYHFMRKSKALYEFNFCMDFPTNALQCLPLLRPVCRDAQVRAIKDVRLTMPAVTSLVRSDRQVKVVHLVRDPRGIAPSISKNFFGAPNNEELIVRKAREMCDVMSRDLKERTALEDGFPHSLLQIYYEDFAERPLAIAQQIYNFIGQDIPNDVIMWLKQSTNSQSAPSESAYETVRKNSTATAYSWKQKLSFETVKKIDALPKCAEFYRLAGYLAVKSESELKNPSIIHRKRSS